jgi:hypothetical protein
MDPLDSADFPHMAFWQSWLEAMGAERMTNDELLLLCREMAPLIEDALAYYLEHRKAPELQEEGTDASHRS